MDCGGLSRSTDITISPMPTTLPTAPISFQRTWHAKSRSTTRGKEFKEWKTRCEYQIEKYEVRWFINQKCQNPSFHLLLPPPLSLSLSLSLLGSHQRWRLPFPRKMRPRISNEDRLIVGSVESSVLAKNSFAISSSASDSLYPFYFSCLFCPSLPFSGNLLRFSRSSLFPVWRPYLKDSLLLCQECVPSK